MNLPNSNRKKSYLVVGVFSLIMLAGVYLTFTSPPSPNKLPRVEQTSVKPIQKEHRTTIGMQYMVRTILVTGLFITFLLLGTKWYRKRWQNKADSPAYFRILGRRYLSSKHYLLLIRVKNHNLLLGVTDQSINLLTSYEGEEEPIEYNLPGDNDPTFASALKGLLRKY